MNSEKVKREEPVNKIFEFFSFLKDAKAIIGLIFAVAASWYDLRLNVSKLESQLDATAQARAVRIEFQKFRDDLQDRDIKNLSEEIKKELKELNRKIDDGRAGTHVKKP